MRIQPKSVPRALALFLTGLLLVGAVVVRLASPVHAEISALQTTTTSPASADSELAPTVIYPPRVEPDIVFPTAGSHGDTATPIKHFITLMQENHSFDNYFGTYPGVDGLPANTCIPWDTDDPAEGCAEPFPIGTRQIVDLGHNSVIFERQYNNGAMNGFLESYANQLDVVDLPVGYYDDNDLPYYWNVADNFVLMDRFFTSAKAGSVPNHFFWATGQTIDPDDRLLQDEGVDCAGCPPVPTIFDRLEEAGVDWKFYVENYDPDITFRNKVTGDRGAQIVWVPILNYNRFLDDPVLNDRIVPFDEYFTDLENGTLPAVSYMVPSGASEHPPGSIQAGERFVRTIITSLQRSEYWDSSAFTWTYDDWGGWYDHVAPPKVDEWGYGFRAPALLVSPYAKQGYVDSTEMDFTSILRFIELNWDLEPLAERDRVANTFIDAFDFDQPPREPVFFGKERDPVPPDEPKQAVVYTSYSLAVAIPLVLSLLGAFLARRSRRSPSES
jgi:phospholipase C